MRYFFAITSLIIAILLFALAVGQRTFLAGPKVIDHTLVFENQADPYIVIPANIFDEVVGNPAVMISADTPFLAIGHERDVEGWVRGFDHGVVQFEAETGEFLVKHKRAVVEDAENTADESDTAVETEDTEDAETSLLDPRGSDLWTAENSAETSLKVTLGLFADQALLLTSGSEEFIAPKNVTLSWAQSRQTPWAGPLFVASGLFALVGVVLYLLALDHNRRAMGPRRGRRGPLQGLRNKKFRQSKEQRAASKSSSRRGTRNAFAVSFAIAGTFLLSSCSSSYWPQFDQIVEEPPAPQIQQAVIPVTEIQLEQILERVVLATTAGDEALDATEIADRLGSSAKLQREANYKILKSDDSWRKLPFLTTDRLSYDLIQSTEKWPRTMLVTVDSRAESIVSGEEDEEPLEPVNAEESDAVTGEDNFTEIEDVKTPALALLMTQNSAHENFVLNRVIELRGGIQMPEAAALKDGTALLADDIKTLQLSPRDAVSTLAEIMQSGEEAEGFELFSFAEEEMLIESMGASWAENHCSDGLKCSVQVALNDEPVVSFSTGQSGALVLATIVDKHTMNVDNDRNIVKLSKVEKALGLEGSYTSVTREWQHQLLLYVPGKDSDKKITVLGSSSELVKVSGKKA